MVSCYEERQRQGQAWGKANRVLLNQSKITVKTEVGKTRKQDLTGEHT